MAIIQNNAYAAVTACHPAAAVKCQQLAQDFSSTYWGGHDSALQSGGAQTDPLQPDVRGAGAAWRVRGARR